MSEKKKMPYHFPDLGELAAYFRKELGSKKHILLYAYNGTGKTRLSMAFKNAGKNDDKRDTLYFNAFTEDLFTWDNDLEGDSERVLKINSSSRFFSGIEDFEMETRIRDFLNRYVDFKIDYETWEVTFSRKIESGDETQTIDNIKVSRGEENIFVWCLFLAIARLALDGEEAYKWVKYIYIDDPISSLDENNAIAVASNLAQLLKNQTGSIKTIISTHHPLFFDVISNELSHANKYFLSKENGNGGYVIRDMANTPFFLHVAILKELNDAAKTGNLYTYHFNMLRSILEKTASFHGFKNFSACINQGNDDLDDILHARLINLLSHGDYSLYEPREMLEENKTHFRNILRDFMNNYKFNPELFADEPEKETKA
jgi:hypothetical protein